MRSLNSNCYYSIITTATTTTHREGCIRINLVLGSDAKASVAVSGSPGQIDGCLQLVIHLLVDGTTKLSAVISEDKTADWNTRKCYCYMYTVSLEVIFSLKILTETLDFGHYILA